MAQTETFVVQRLVSLPDGNTTVDTVEVPWTVWERGGVSGLGTPLFEGAGVIFRHLQADDGSWHAPPDKQFVFVLDGRGVLEASDGSVLELERGSMFYMDNRDSKGHFNRSLGPTGLVVALLPLVEETDLGKPM